MSIVFILQFLLYFYNDVIEFSNFIDRVLTILLSCIFGEHEVFFRKLPTELRNIIMRI